MQYLLTGIELHPDKGFGITADTYYKSAEQLMNNHFEYYESTPQAEMPQNFLFRHSIELYLKSLIIIFHKKLKINYGTVPFDSNEPEIFADGKWRKLYACHFIDILYGYWLNNLLLPNIEQLNKVASKGDWQEAKKVSDLFPIICKYDQDSSYFRYPVTKNSSLDVQKFTMQKFKATSVEQMVKEIQEQKAAAKEGTFTILMVDNGDNVVGGFKRVENILVEVRDALYEVASYFYCIHIMTRMTLCDGM